MLFILLYNYIEGMAKKLPYLKKIITQCHSVGDVSFFNLQGVIKV